MVLDGLAQALPGFLDPVGFGHPLVHTQPRAPEARGARFAIAPDRQDRARLEADNLAVDRARGLDVAVGKEFVDRAIIDGEAVAGQHPQRADFRGEGDSAVLLGDVERLDPQRVARQSEHALAPVPDRGGAHPFEPQPGFVAPADGRERPLPGFVGAAAHQFGKDRPSQHLRKLGDALGELLGHAKATHCGRAEQEPDDQDRHLFAADIERGVDVGGERVSEDARIGSLDRPQAQAAPQVPADRLDAESRGPIGDRGQELGHRPHPEESRLRPA